MQQNAAITAGTISGIKINLKVLGVGDGLTVGSEELLCFIPCLHPSERKGSLISIPWIHHIRGIEPVSSRDVRRWEILLTSAADTTRWFPRRLSRPRIHRTTNPEGVNPRFNLAIPRDQRQLVPKPSLIAITTSSLLSLGTMTSTTCWRRTRILILLISRLTSAVRL